MAEIQYGNLLFDIGTGAFLGFIIGYISKVLVKILLALIVVYISSLFYLQHRGIIDVNTGKLGNISPIDIGLEGIGGTLNNFLGFLPIGGGFVAGFYLGYKKT